jgi:uncharacterized protein YicC (UPF0701 family)
MPRQDLIDMKLNQVIGPMIADLKANQQVTQRIGGHTVTNLGEEIKMQTARQLNLEWAKTATDADIQAEIDRLSATLTAEELACKYGSVRGMALEKIEVIAKIEDLEIALGTHPGVGE